MALVLWFAACLWLMSSLNWLRGGGEGTIDGPPGPGVRADSGTQGRDRTDAGLHELERALLLGMEEAEEAAGRRQVDLLKRYVAAVRSAPSLSAVGRVRHWALVLHYANCLLNRFRHKDWCLETLGPALEGRVGINGGEELASIVRRWAGALAAQGSERVLTMPAETVISGSLEEGPAQLSLLCRAFYEHAVGQCDAKIVRAAASDHFSAGRSVTSEALFRSIVAREEKGIIAAWAQYMVAQSVWHRVAKMMPGSALPYDGDWLSRKEYVEAVSGFKAICARWRAAIITEYREALRRDPPRNLEKVILAELATLGDRPGGGRVDPRSPLPDSIQRWMPRLPTQERPVWVLDSDGKR